VFARDIQPALVADGVVRLGTDLVSWYLLEDGGRVVVVDGGLPPYRAQLERGLAVLGKARSDIDAIVLTHGHGDHTGVVEPLREELSLPVHVHEGDEELTTTGKSFGKTEWSMLRYLRYPQAWKLLSHFKSSGKSKPVQTVQTFDGDGAELPGGLRAIHTGGHTSGHVVLYHEGKRVLFVGDLIATLNPLTGGRGPELLPRALSLSTATMLDSLTKLEPLDVDVVLFGHGDPWTEGAEAAVRRAREIGPT
jgi:glyoxylase-like metal-dependent hydrolase (beta-lactamase superfamily II)